MRDIREWGVEGLSKKRKKRERTHRHGQWCGDGRWKTAWGINGDGKNEIKFKKHKSKNE